MGMPVWRNFSTEGQRPIDSLRCKVYNCSISTADYCFRIMKPKGYHNIFFQSWEVRKFYNLLFRIQSNLDQIQAIKNHLTVSIPGRILVFKNDSIPFLLS
jgi:hypothetical protein